VTNDPGASNRTYLSIGEALDALKIEFPDVTISKIRFLEGQGLVEPERTPSGYRKFTLVDVERLRWVLRQQQESYIPLKVIRERLSEAEGQGIVPRTLPRPPSLGERATNAFNSMNEEANPVVTNPSGSAVGPVGSSLASLAKDGLDDFDDLGEIEDFGDLVDNEDADDADDADSDESAFNPSRLVSGATHGDESPESMGEFRHPASRARSANLRPELIRTPAAPTTPRLPAASSERSAASLTAQSVASKVAPVAPVMPAMPAMPAVASSVDQKSLTSSRLSTPLSVEVAESRLGSGNPMLGPSGGAALTFAELASASGLSLDDLRLIEEFGLVVGRQKFDGKYYDDDALLVAKTVVAFRAFGIEPRHLRMYKSAAEREAAFFAQALSPMLHRRGDEARTKAADTMNELRRLGEQLRDAALRNALRDVLEGR
jgi:DNA-binding transcriptional MerR regulator